MPSTKFEQDHRDWNYRDESLPYAAYSEFEVGHQTSSGVWQRVLHVHLVNTVLHLLRIEAEAMRRRCLDHRLAEELKDDTSKLQFGLLKHTRFPCRIFCITGPGSYQHEMNSSFPAVNAVRRNCLFVDRVLEDVIESLLVGEWINVCQNMHNGKSRATRERSFNFEL